MRTRLLLALLCAATAAFSQDSYRIRAGEATAIDAPSDTRGRNAAGILVAPDATGDHILAAASVNTPPGEYDVSVTIPGRAARTVHVSVRPLARAAAGTTPVILLNGFQISTLTGGCPPAPGPSDTFGALPGLLTADGLTVYFFDNCVEGPAASIEALGARLGQFIAGLKDENGAPVAEVDLVGHSMGGLISRAYLAGLHADGSLTPPSPTKVRKFVEIATPNFGSYLADNNRNALNAQARQMIPGSPFLYSLATWNQRHDDLRGADALAIIGNGGYAAASGTPTDHASDGVVSTTSASLGFARDPSRTRLLPYCHIDSSGLVQLFVNCSGTGIAKAPETHAAVRSFLSGTDAWQSVGTSAGQDPILSQAGGVFVAASNNTGQFYTDLTAASFGSTALSPGGNGGTVFYREFISGSETIHFTSAARGDGQCGPIGVPAGYYTVIRCKSGLEITSVGPLVPDTTARIVRSGGTVTIAGNLLGDCVNPVHCELVANPGNVPLEFSSWVNNRIQATLPAGFSGLTTIRVGQLATGDEISFLADPGDVSGEPVITAVVNGASFLPGIQRNSWVTIRGSNLAPTARTWNPATEIVDGVLPTTLDGVHVTINGKPAVLYYISANQLNVLAPSDAIEGLVEVEVKNALGTSGPFPARLQPFAPGLFAFDPQGSRYAAATHADGSLLGPPDLYGGAVTLSPAQPGEAIVLYGTGFGPTKTPVPYDRVFQGVAQLTGDISITIGGQPAQIFFQGVTSNGLFQLNVYVPDLADGDHAIVATAGGVESQQAVFLTVKR